MQGNWLPNPYALAQVLTDKLDLDSLYNEDGASVDAFLSAAFQSLDKGKTLADMLALFQQLAEAVKTPMPIAEVMNLVEAKRAAEVFDPETIKLLLPYLVPISDEEFSASPDNAGSGPARRSWFADAKQLTIDNTSYLDPVQGAVGDCYLIAAMSSLAWCKRDVLEISLRSAGFSPPTQRFFKWKFFDGEGSERGLVKVSGRIPIAGKKAPRYAKATSGESWPGLVEKAFVINARSSSRPNSEPTPADYQLIDRNCTPQRACQALVGGDMGEEILEFEEGKKIFFRMGKLGSRSGGMSDQGVMLKPAMAWTKKDIGVSDSKIWEKTGLWPSHAYSVLGVMGDPDQPEHVVLRNPHGVATDPETREGYAKGTWQAGDQPVELNKNGVFAITAKLFYEKFGDIGWINIRQNA